MLLPTQDQISAATRAQLQAQLDLWTSLNNKAIEGLMQLADLNMAAVRKSLESSSQATHRLLSTEKPTAPFWMESSRSQQDIGDVLSYSRAAAHIALGIGAEMAKLMEKQIDTGRQEAVKLFGDVANTIPNGSAMEFMKSALGNAASSYQQWVKTTEEAAETMRHGLLAGTETAAQQAAKTHRRAKH